MTQYLADVVMARPYGFSVGELHFHLYPVTLGKMFLLQKQVEALGINIQNVEDGVFREALRIARECRETCLKIITYHTCKTKDEIFDAVFTEERQKFFDKELSDEDIASLMVIVLTQDRMKELISFLGIDKEQERMNAVLRIKKKEDKNTLDFGGISIYGSLIDAVCERYGWTKDYVVWGIDYVSMRMMLADRVNSVYCTDDEMKKIPKQLRGKKEETIKADSRENIEKIKRMGWR